jgi:hypothetical protein
MSDDRLGTGPMAGVAKLFAKIVERGQESLFFLELTNVSLVREKAGVSKCGILFVRFRSSKENLYNSFLLPWGESMFLSNWAANGPFVHPPDYI